MKKIKFLQITFLMNSLFLFGCFLTTQIFAQKINTQKLTPREIAQQTLPSTVLLVMGNETTKKVKSGSGFFVAEDVVATNFHVIKETTDGYAKIYGQDKIYKVLGTIGIDEKNDLALIKLSGIKGKPLKINTDDSIAIGDEIFAVGNPEGLEGTFSQGIVSSIRKSEKINLLQITASISEGSSGGAVLNEKGEVVGIAVGAIESGQSLNFAIPVFFLRGLASQKNLVKPLSSKQLSSQPNKISVSNNTQLPKSEFPKGNLKKTKFSILQENTANWYRLNIFGQVKRIAADYYLPIEKFGKWILDKQVAKSIQTFNFEGYENFFEYISYNEEGLKALNQNAKTEKNEFPITTRWEYIYDYENNQVTYKRLVKCANCISHKLDFSSISKYRVNGDDTFSLDGKLVSKKIIEESGNGKIEYKYNSSGRIFSKIVSIETSVGTETKIYFALLSDSLPLSSHYISQKEENQDTVKITIIPLDEKETKRSITVTNKNTNLLLYSETNGEVLKYSYEFDKQGNWIKKSEFKQVTKFGKTYYEPSSVVFREITYY